MKIKNTITRTALSLSALAALITGGLLYAGPLNPPPGPVTSTYKTLTEVEPRIAINATNTPGNQTAVFYINEPGSYYLTENVIGEPGKNGIRIFAVGAVTIDLNGFSIINPSGPGGGGGYDGIVVNVFGASRVSVRNGSISGWPGDGIDMATTITASQCVISGVLARGNGQNGINVGTATLISECVATGNTGIGIATSSGCVITRCLASSNGSDGFLLGSGSTISGCTAYLNTEDGIQTNTGCTVSACTAYANTGDGIEVGSGSVITSNTCSNNGFGAGDGANIHATGTDSRIEGNNCTGADRGIDVDVAGNIIIRNTCSNNGTNWDFVAGNSFGTIVVSTGATAPAINTNGGAAGTLTTTDPNANFSY